MTGRLFTGGGIVVCWVAAFAATAHARRPVEKTDSQLLLQWIQKNSDTKTALPFSHIGDDRFTNWTLTYDAAVVTMASLVLNDVATAKRIIDFYESRTDVWRLGGVIESVNTMNAVIGEDWSVRSLSNAWLGLAAFRIYERTGESRYLAFAEKEADFLITLQSHDATELNVGGIRFGPAGTDQSAGDQHLGNDPTQPRFDEIYGTEEALSAYALFKLLAPATKEDRYRQSAEAVWGWIKRVGYNAESQRFNKSAYHVSVDSSVVTHVQSWAISAIGPDRLESLADNLAENLAAFVEDNCIVEVAYGRSRIEGADFVDIQTSRNSGREAIISPELSFQFANALGILRRYFQSSFPDKTDRYGQRRAELIKEMLAFGRRSPDGIAFPYASLPNADIGREYETPDAGTLSAIGGAYGILALEDWDPLK